MPCLRDAFFFFLLRSRDSRSRQMCFIHLRIYLHREERPQQLFAWIEGGMDCGSEILIPSGYAVPRPGPVVRPSPPWAMLSSSLARPSCAVGRRCTAQRFSFTRVTASAVLSVSLFPSMTFRTFPACLLSQPGRAARFRCRCHDAGTDRCGGEFQSVGSRGGGNSSEGRERDENDGDEGSEEGARTQQEEGVAHSCSVGAEEGGGGGGGGEETKAPEVDWMGRRTDQGFPETAEASVLSPFAAARREKILLLPGWVRALKPWGDFLQVQYAQNVVCIATRDEAAKESTLRSNVCPSMGFAPSVVKTDILVLESIVGAAVFVFAGATEDCCGRWLRIRVALAVVITRTSLRV